jgi:hypothetical protein
MVVERVTIALCAINGLLCLSAECTVVLGGGGSTFQSAPMSHPTLWKTTQCGACDPMTPGQVGPELWGVSFEGSVSPPIDNFTYKFQLPVIKHSVKTPNRKFWKQTIHNFSKAFYIAYYHHCSSLLFLLIFYRV